MALPTGWTVQISAIRAGFDVTGSNPVAHIDFSIYDSTGAQIGGRTHTLTNEGQLQHDPITGDGVTTTFTTSKSPYAGSPLRVILDGQLQTSGYTQTTNANGTIAVTFTTAPAKDANGNLNYAIGPGLTNAAGNLPTVLGLVSGNGTVYSGTVNGQPVATSHQHITDLASALLAWASARVNQDIFGG